MLFWSVSFSGSTWAPVKPLLVLPEGVEGASLGLLVVLGGGGACWTWKTENNVALGLFSGHLVLLGFAVYPCQCCCGGKPLLGHLLPLGGGQQPWSLRWYQPLGGSLGDTGPTGATGTGRGAVLPSPGEGTVPPAWAPLLLMRLQEGQDYRHDIWVLPLHPCRAAAFLAVWQRAQDFLMFILFSVYDYWQVWAAGISSAQSEGTWKIKRENSGSPQWWCSQSPRPLFNPPSFHVSESFDDGLLTCLQRIQ